MKVARQIFANNAPESCTCHLAALSECCAHYRSVSFANLGRGRFCCNTGSVIDCHQSSDDAPLLKVLGRELPTLEAAVPVELHYNDTNIGFIGSVNFGFAKAIAENRDALILNSDVIVFPGAFSEMRQVAYCDHMIGFVSPRSNNATICSLPNDDSYRHRSVEASRASFEIIARYLPRYRYVPTAVGFCLYIKWVILDEFGVFDPIYGKGCGMKMTSLCGPINADIVQCSRTTRLYFTLARSHFP